MIGIVVPCYNEEAVLEDLIKEFEVLRKELDFDLILVDDGSIDKTSSIIKQASKKKRWIKSISHSINQGIAQSLKDGFSYAVGHGYDAVAQMDADLTHPPETLVQMFEELERGADLVVASRYTGKGGMKNVPRWRVVLSIAGNKAFKCVLRIKTSDSTSGFRLARREFHERLKLKADSFGIQLEMTVRAERAGFLVKEVPFVLINREKGTSKFKLRYLIGYIPLMIKLMVSRNRS